MSRWVLPSLVLLLCAAPVAAQQIRGDVREVGSGDPIEGVVLTALGPDSVVRGAALSEPNGSFRLDVPPLAGLRLRAQRAGYAAQRSEPLTLARGDTLRVAIGLRPEAVEVEGVTVQAVTNPNLRHFLRRQDTGFGQYAGPDDIAALPTKATTHALLGIPNSGLLLAPSGRSVLMNARGPTPRGGGSALCAPTIYVDGYSITGEREMGGGTRWGPRSPLGDVSIESHVPQGKLRAVEVYRNPSNAPPEYQRSFMDCGVVLIWTDYGFGFEVPSARGAGVQDSGAESSTLAAP